MKRFELEVVSNGYVLVIPGPLGSVEDERMVFTEMTDVFEELTKRIEVIHDLMDFGPDALPAGS